MKNRGIVFLWASLGWFGVCQAYQPAESGMLEALNAHEGVAHTGGKMPQGSYKANAVELPVGEPGAKKGAWARLLDRVRGKKSLPPRGK